MTKIVEPEEEDSDQEDLDQVTLTPTGSQVGCGTTAITTIEEEDEDILSASEERTQTQRTVGEEEEEREGFREGRRRQGSRVPENTLTRSANIVIWLGIALTTFVPIVIALTVVVFKTLMNIALEADRT